MNIQLPSFAEWTKTWYAMYNSHEDIKLSDFYTSNYSEIYLKKREARRQAKLLGIQLIDSASWVVVLNNSCEIKKKTKLCFDANLKQEHTSSGTDELMNTTVPAPTWEKKRDDKGQRLKKL